MISPCRVKPLEYAYWDDSVNRAESSSANCEHYRNGIKSGINTSKYIHCDGSQLQLSDSNLGQELHHIPHKNLLDYHHTALLQ